MNSIKDVLFSLCSACGTGNIDEASLTAEKILSQYAECERKSNLTVIGRMKGESDYTLMLDAHIDEVGFVVTDISDDGFLTVAKCGGIDLRGLAAKRVMIHSKQKVTGVFCSTPPHLAVGEVEYTDISAQKIDTALGGKAKDIISVGDYVTFCNRPAELLGSRVTAKALDDRAGVAVLLELSRRLSGKKLPINVVFVLSDMEELGLRGAKTATFGIEPDEAVAIDVSFGDALDVAPHESGKLAGGAMIGISPILSREISDRLTAIARENGIKYQPEVMGGRTGTNCDEISISACGVKTGLISIPQRNMHTDVEVVDLQDLESICDILEKYIMAGGVKND